MNPNNTDAPLTHWNAMRKYAHWLLWAVAILALLGAAQARLNSTRTAEPKTCDSYLYWESPLLR
jgi:hypothetical protein